ncbi:MAG: DNA/RNA non-specific endonuclease [Chloroflexota bacterium]
MKKVLLCYALAAFAAFVGCSDASTSGPVINPPKTYSGDSVHIELGIPTDANPSDDFLIWRHQFVISYNPTKGIPNWVSYNLDENWYGEEPRYDGNFISDVSLPSDFYRVTHDDYTNSGYDRGHMVRSEERTRNREDNKATFLLTNICPQTPDLNRGCWLDFEYFCEDLCKKNHKELFIITGVVSHSNKTLGGLGHVVVPDSCFKIVVALEKGQSVASLTAFTPVYAVVMPNVSGIRKDDWKKYATTIDKIEALTGYDFLNWVKESLQSKLEAQVFKS